MPPPAKPFRYSPPRTGCGTIHLPSPERHPDDQRPPTHSPTSSPKGMKRLLQILISESAHLIWVLRCERAIQNKSHSCSEIESRWLHKLNARLTEDRIIATRIRRDKTHLALVASTWEPILSRDSNLPILSNLILNCEVLVGTRHLRSP